MIQRIQTVFLFLAAGAAFGTFGLPFATTNQQVEASTLFADASFTVMDRPVMMGGFALAGLVLLVAIFLFNNRKLQMTITKISLVLLGFGVGVGLYAFLNDQASEQAQVAIGVGLPFLSAILAYLANRYINKDEKLVRSVDRLR